MKQKINAVVLGGGTLKGDSIPKAFIPVGGRPLIAAAIDAICQYPDLGEIRIVAEPSLVARHFPKVARAAVPPGVTVIESMRVGVKGWPDDKPVLFISGDMPLVKADMLGDFVTQCAKWSRADAWLTFVSKHNAEGALPGFEHTYTRLTEGTFCMGGIALVRPAVLASTKVDELERLRKSAWRLALHIGIVTLIQSKLGLLPRYALEMRLGDLLGCCVASVESRFGGLSVDIDNQQRLACYQQWLEQRQS